MYNLICNSKWCPSSCEGPTYFHSCGPITYDEFFLHENRTCSVSIPTCHQSSAGIYYDLSIQTLDHHCIAWGCCIRAIQAQQVILRADFYDRCQELIATAKQNVCEKICADFQDIVVFFEIPKEACSVQLSIEFCGFITACTLCAPFAYFDD